jgi:signal peptidase I
MSELHFDFAVMLSALTLFTGVFWALDKWWFAPRRMAAAPPGAEDRPNAFLDFCRSFFPVIALVLFLRSFIAEPFRIPSGSMIPTLLVGDFLLVNKFSFGLRDPVFHYKFIEIGEPKRGDIVVFRWPRDPSTDFIKRIVGIPGDHIVYKDKVLFINGEEAVQQPDGIYAAAGLPPPGAAARAVETINGVQHYVLADPNRPAEDAEYIVPEGQYFAMGDNRDGSFDSRGWGTVPEQNLVGKAFFIWMSWDAERFRPNFSRIGNAIK